jgi:hypothetical protein
MIRSSASKAVMLTAAMLFSGTAFVNCSSTKNTTANVVSDTGSVGLAVKLSPGVNVDKVDYKISGNGITPVTGSIVVSDPGASVSVLVNGLPAGMGYLVELSAVSSDGKTTCGGSSTFDIVANGSTSVTVALQCKTPKTTGSVVVGGTFNNCPALVSYTAAPLAVATNGIITVGATASDLDPMTTLTYAWTATGGSFASAASAATTYTCSAAGAQTLTITVSDGTCTDSATISVSCVALSCGNGAIDQGEQCDPPSAANHCDANCQIIPVCGNGMVQTGEQCDPPNGITCDNACKNIPIVCGNSIVQPGETCDPPNGNTCDATCHTAAALTCGDGIVSPSIGEECEPPSTATCTATCKSIDLCGACETAKCDATLAGCGSLTGSDKAACLALVACIRVKHCAPVGDAFACYCGTASDIACLTGMGNGACKPEMEAAAKTTDPGIIANIFVDPSFPIGRATNLVGCDAESCKMQCPL